MGTKSAPWPLPLQPAGRGSEAYCGIASFFIHHCVGNVIERVPVEDQDVSELADLDRAKMFLEANRLGAEE